MEEGQIKHLRPNPRIGSLKLNVIWTGMGAEVLNLSLLHEVHYKLLLFILVKEHLLQTVSPPHGILPTAIVT
jgi:hypothetical protein